MNAKARALGLADTHFANPHGLDEAGHVSSARDATLLVRYALGVPFIREALGRYDGVAPGRAELPDDRRPARELAAARRREDRAHGRRRLVAGRGRGRAGARPSTGPCSARATRGARNDALQDAPRSTGSTSTGASRSSTRAASTRRPRRATGSPTVELVAPRTIARYGARGHVRSSSASSRRMSSGFRCGRAQPSAASRCTTGDRLRRVVEPRGRDRRLGAGPFRQGAVVCDARPPRNLWELVT